MPADVLTRIGRLRRKRTRRVVGLISGTSADGVSAVVTEITGSGVETRLRVVAFRTYPYPAALREEVFRLFSAETATVDRACEMNFVLGGFFADCAIRLVEEAGLNIGDIDLIGSHGQTIHHSPQPGEVCGYGTRSTLQIGEPAVIAERTGVPTVADFRKADIAAGGEGAPLTPYLDYILHRHPELSRVLQNIGGIANLTYLPAGASAQDVVAFDTGPGNTLIDAVVRHYTGGAQTYDRDGRIAARGTVDATLLQELLSHPYFSRRPPKTTGREEFGEAFARKVISRGEALGLGFEDIVATAAALTVESIARAYEHHLPEGRAIDEVYVSGGGARNRFLMEALRSRLDPIPVLPYDRLGIPCEAKEAVLMAVLANEHISGNPSNLPAATGARRAVVLGALFPAS
ncbi:anhydro-N-acetylmuramic acid kinase [Candidatus Bathyarchaeota archaeon]|nr:MAG: anhydro-N-acetylmuramic acid kinase [Candidatus Bathyarchaeota archaeon]